MTFRAASAVVTSTSQGRVDKAMRSRALQSRDESCNCVRETLRTGTVVRTHDNATALQSPITVRAFPVPEAFFSLSHLQHDVVLAEIHNTNGNLGLSPFVIITKGMSLRARTNALTPGIMGRTVREVIHADSLEPGWCFCCLLLLEEGGPMGQY